MWVKGGKTKEGAVGGGTLWEVEEQKEMGWACGAFGWGEGGV